MYLKYGTLLVNRRDAAQGALLIDWIRNHVLPAFEDRIVAVDVSVALACAALQVPDPRPERDSLIAATALVHRLKLVTRNVKDFAATGVMTLDPWQPLMP